MAQNRSADVPAAKDIGEKQNLAETMPERADEMSATMIAYLKK